ncbi:amidohydrolase family protein [Leifsonia sp. F6_8S_P_1B]|uniref:Amidohydrolase family protein n=1 Tax=Leifsonia williamsii TaxID=3035919 RepID=A0ABT8K8I2_9MICO|nr:amidohydrolase family protein [Leifsonia williamsii]MDN4613781.1 amidohydrolase family protein [Leifsonia williamsii]
MTTAGWQELAQLRLADWAPRSMMRSAETVVERPAAPVVDVHNHLGRWLSDGEWMIPDVPALLRLLDDCGVQTVVNLDGMWGEEVTANVERYDRAHPGRFLTFCQLEWERLAAPDGVAALVASLEDSVARGARGLKVWKNLGLTVRDADGALILPDDPRVVAVLRRAGELGLPVLIHTADPIAFFEPADRHNERLDELSEVPEWWFGDRDRYPSFDTLLDAHAALALACPQTSFIGAHAGCAAEDLDRVESLLEAAPNYTIDTAGRMAELGRQPRRFARLVAAHPDRVLFGTDIFPITAEQYRLHYRFFETADEGFRYDPAAEIPPQGRWDVSALALAPELLEGVYAGNARRVLGI